MGNTTSPYEDVPSVVSNSNERRVDRIATEALQEYTAVRTTTAGVIPTSEGSLGSDDDEYVGGAVVVGGGGSTLLTDDSDEGGRPAQVVSSHKGSPPRHRRPPMHPSADVFSSASWSAGRLVFASWLIISGFILILAIGLFTVRHKSLQGHTAAAPISKSHQDEADLPLTVTYQSQIPPWNPFDLPFAEESSLQGTASSYHLLTPPTFPYLGNTQGPTVADDDQGLGFLTQPDLVNHTLVFVTEGDLYWTTLPSSGTETNAPPQLDNQLWLSAVRLTTTVGNVRTPKLHPYQPHLVAFTATYAGRREVYLLDFDPLRSRAQPAVRLTYWADHPFGVVSLVGWTPDGASLIVAAFSQAVSLPDLRLYRIILKQPAASSSSSTPATGHVYQIVPIPLAQATEGSYQVETTDSDGAGNGNECLYFTRYKQGSHTARYVGGTAESLWVYCTGAPQALPLTRDYNGTSKAPVVVHLHSNSPNNEVDGPFLFFLSDRQRADLHNWRPTTMNVWAMPLPSTTDLLATGWSGPDSSRTMPLTHASCAMNGLAVQEYTVDPVTNMLVVRVGADLYYMSGATVRSILRPPYRNTKAPLQKLRIRVFSDFYEQQERLIPVDIKKHLSMTDIFETSWGDPSVLMTLRGQVWVAPVTHDSASSRIEYQGAGQNMPPRRYRIIPGALLGGSIRVLKALYVPEFHASTESAAVRRRRLAVILATDPLSPTAEHAFYLVSVQPSSLNQFASLDYIPRPFLGGHVTGGSVADGGLGSVRAVSISPCGRRMAWTDTDGRICVVTLPLDLYGTNATDPSSMPQYAVLPHANNMGEPMYGTQVDKLIWSPGGRYLTLNHEAKNQFTILTVVDCGDPAAKQIQLGRSVQVTPSRFNCFEPYWGKTTMDAYLNKKLTTLASSLGVAPPDDISTTLYFLTDRDVVTDVGSPWGNRAPAPHFPNELTVYGLPFTAKGSDELLGHFAGGAAQEVFSEYLAELENKFQDKVGNSANHDTRRVLKDISSSLRQGLRARRLSMREAALASRYLQSVAANATINLTADESAGAKQKSASTFANSTASALSNYPKDMDIDLGDDSFSLARQAFRVAQMPKGPYQQIVAQTSDGGSFVMIVRDDTLDFPQNLLSMQVSIFSPDPFPSDRISETSLSKFIMRAGLSTDRQHLYLIFSPDGKLKVVENTDVGLTSLILDAAGASAKVEKDLADTSRMALSIWPALEHRQMFNDAWRLLRDYFYDPNMHGVDWPSVYTRYSALVERTSKREELDDILGQLAAELSALHVFVYGGEYATPFDNDPVQIAINTPASLGAALQRMPEWKGYAVTEIPEPDPDFGLLDDKGVYSPLSDQALQQSGQRGLAVGDVIVGVNGESTMEVVDIHMLLRGLAGRSVRLDVIRLQSGSPLNATDQATVEPLMVVPLSPDAAASLRYNAWEWKTRQKAMELAAKANFTVGYIHMQSMMTNDEDAFARGYFPDYDKEALILDVRHNRGGNIDSWIISVLQRRAWMYWGQRVGVRNSGDMDWNMQFAFRGHLVVLMDEGTASDGEGVSRGIKELGLGRLIGTRTWGGGIWLSSDNILVDGGIATAPEVGVFNGHMGWGMDIEQHGVIPDVEVDNNPRTAFDGVDTQLERAIEELRKWLDEEPVAYLPGPLNKPDLSLHQEDCPA